MDLDNSTEWKERDLVSLITEGVEESVLLDYKACPSLTTGDKEKTEISKDVSSFANSAGGTIVYGMIEKDHKPVDIDLGYDPRVITKEWLEHVIHGKIQPRINGLYINPVELTTKNPGKVVYVVTVPRGTTAHQASDRRYYKRFNFGSHPMEDHEVRDVMNRLKFPLVTPEFSCERQNHLSKGSTQVYLLKICLRNSGAMSAREMKLVFYFPQSIKNEVNGRGFRQQVIAGEITVPGSRTENIELSTSQITWTLFPEDCYKLTDEDSRYQMKFTIDLGALELLLAKNPYIVWRMYADDMPPQDGKIPIGDLPGFSR